MTIKVKPQEAKRLARLIFDLQKEKQNQYWKKYPNNPKKMEDFFEEARKEVFADEGLARLSQEEFSAYGRIIRKEIHRITAKIKREEDKELEEDRKARMMTGAVENEKRHLGIK